MVRAGADGDALDHPLECAIAQAGVEVAAAHVLVAAGKPHLLEVLSRRWFRPQRGHKGTTELVHGHRVASVPDVRVERDVVELVAAR
ncbi:MAG TPA: hypothetical protein VGO16_05215 [Pseudonocardiaceae bacterium]|nr:hypothetical protein [Pseudonocardiaceae bacterium]